MTSSHTDSSHAASSQIEVQSFNKRVRVWSGRNRCQVTVFVDYQRITSGAFTLICLGRLRDSVGHDSQMAEQHARRDSLPPVRAIDAARR